MTAISDTIAARHAQYGSYDEQAACAQRFKQVMAPKIVTKNFDYDMAESLDMIATKLSRILCGNPNNPDHWHDIAGYATLIEQRLRRDTDNKRASGSQ